MVFKSLVVNVLSREFKRIPPFWSYWKILNLLLSNNTIFEIDLNSKFEFFQFLTKESLSTSVYWFSLLRSFFNVCFIVSHPLNQIKIIPNCPKWALNTFLEISSRSLVWLSKSCASACRFHTHVVVLGPLANVREKWPGFVG